jgi:hypothetical protein
VPKKDRALRGLGQKYGDRQKEVQPSTQAAQGKEELSQLWLLEVPPLCRRSVGMREVRVQGRRRRIFL